ncbi:uncharacterized protein LOC141701996 [Apium graveolens]|uniref:uncharacterized protein LOC141701996 n=1 Tax=Apium graveolens TaxID=4045 RepID=UPI003D798101
MPYKCSWTVRKLFNAREGFSSFMKFDIGPNSVFSFWHDPWANGKSLIHISDSIVSTAESTSMVPINVYLRNGVWDLPSSNHVDIIEVRNIVNSVRITRYDAIYWDGLLTRNIKISDIWNSIRTSNDLMPWADFVWNSFSIPKCSFITWLAILNRLLTRDRMLMLACKLIKYVFCATLIENPLITFSQNAHILILCVKVSISIFQKIGQIVFKGTSWLAV